MHTHTYTHTHTHIHTHTHTHISTQAHKTTPHQKREKEKEKESERVSMLARSLLRTSEKERERGGAGRGEGGREGGRESEGHLDEEVSNVAELRQGERLEQDDFIQAIQEFGPEMSAHIRHDVCHQIHTQRVTHTCSLVFNSGFLRYLLFVQ